MNKTLLTALLAAVIGSAVTIGVLRFRGSPAPAQPPPSAAPAPPPAAEPSATPPETIPIETPPPAPAAPPKAAARPKTEAPKPAVKPAPEPVAAEEPPADSPSPAPVETDAPARTAPVVAAAAQPASAPTPAEPPAPAPPPEPRRPLTVTIAAGTLVTIRLQQALSSDTNQPGDEFTANLDQPFVVGDLVLAEKGARVAGRVVTAEKSGRVKGLGQLSIKLVSLHTSDGQDLAISTDPFETIAEKSTREDAEKVGIGTVIGAAIGAIAGGGKGAAIGAAAGGGAGAGAVLATRGKPAEIASEARITFRINQPLTVTEKLH